jgi:hypothetical protein
MKLLHKIFNALFSGEISTTAIGKFIYFHRINDANTSRRGFMKWKSFPCFMNAREIIPGQELMQKQLGEEAKGSEENYNQIRENREG